MWFASPALSWRMPSVPFNYVYMEDTPGSRYMAYLLKANLEAHLWLSLILLLGE